MAVLHRRILTWLLLVCLAFSGIIALGEEAYYPFEDDPLGAYLPSDWAVLTRQNLNQNNEMLKTLGLSQQEAATGFAQQHLLAYALTGEGTQLLLKAYQAPGSWSYPLFIKGDKEQKELFVQWVNDQYATDSSGSWVKDSLFLLQVEDIALPLITHIYATFIEDTILLWEVPVMDRPFAQEEEQAVITAFDGLLYLGQKEDSSTMEAPQAAATLAPQEPMASPPPATVKVTRDNTPLTFDYVPSTWHTTVLTLTGTTQPKAELRYYINEVGYQRFEADEEGRFTVEISAGLGDGKNTISFQTVGENGYGNVSFSVDIQRGPAPFTLSPTPKEIPSPNYLVTGSALPGAVIQIAGKQKTYETMALDNGSFSVEVYMPRMGDNVFTFSASGSGYKKNSEELILHRSKGPEEAREEFMKKTIRVDYQKLMDNPTAFAGKNAALEGEITRLYSKGSTRGFVFEENNTKNTYFVLTDSLVGLMPGTTAQVLVTLEEEPITLDLPVSSLLPRAQLFLLFPH